MDYSLLMSVHNVDQAARENVSRPVESVLACHLCTVDSVCPSVSH